jgi:hypothetical protein
MPGSADQAAARVAPIVGRVCYTRGYFQGRGSPHSPLVELFNKLNSILVTL